MYPLFFAAPGGNYIQRVATIGDTSTVTISEEPRSLGYVRENANNSKEHFEDEDEDEDTYTGTYPVFIFKTGIVHQHNGDTRTYADVVKSKLY